MLLLHLLPRDITQSSLYSSLNLHIRRGTRRNSSSSSSKSIFDKIEILFFSIIEVGRCEVYTRDDLVLLFTQPASQVSDAARRRAPCSTDHCRSCSGSSSRSPLRGCARNVRARSTGQEQRVQLSSGRPSRQ